MSAALLPIVLSVLLLCVATPALAACAYLLFLTLWSACLPAPRRTRVMPRFDIVVPAHDEAAVIGRCLASLHRLDWPAQRLQLIVLADNCNDATAAVARGCGVRVIVRDDQGQQGKGYALQRAFNDSLATSWADAVVIIDADTQVSADLLQAFAVAMEGGAGVGQARYGVLNATESWRTGLMAIAHGAFHDLRSQARERLRLSCGIRGNGWFVTHDVLRQVPYAALSLTEDLEYGITLGLAGHRVHYVAAARVDAVMESSEAVARRQRQRWEDGRLALMKAQVVPLLRTAVARRSAVCLDLALDLLVLPLSYVACNLLLLAVLAAVASIWVPALMVWCVVAAGGATVLVVYVLRGWQLSGRGAAGLLDLMRAPWFVLWKLLTLLRPHDRRRWTPTRRRGP